MSNIKKFKNPLSCVCGNIVLFEIIPEIECDWGCHTVIQCPKCEELFSVDIKCPAFQTIEKLFVENVGLYSAHEKFSYLSNPHSF